MPTRAQLRPVDPLLTNFGLEFNNGLGGVADVLFPPKPVDGETGSFNIYESDTLFRQYNDQRANAAEANVINLRLTKGTYTCEEYALRYPVTDRDRDNQMGSVDLDQDGTRAVTEALALAREMRARDIIFCSTATQLHATFEGTASPLWSTTSSTPLQDVETIHQTMQARIGRRANTLIIPPAVWKFFLNDASTYIGAYLSDRIKYTTPTTAKNITPQLVAQWLGVDNVYVPGMIFSSTPMSTTIGGTNTAAATAALSGITGGKYIWDYKSDNSTAAKAVIFAYIDPSAGPKGMTFGWDFQSEQFAVRRYREDSKRTDWIEAGRVEQQKVVSNSAIYRYIAIA